MTQEPYVGPVEVDNHFGLPLSWVYDAASRKRIPSLKIGKYRGFRLSEVEAALRGKGDGKADPLVPRQEVPSK